MDLQLPPHLRNILCTISIYQRSLYSSTISDSNLCFRLAAGSSQFFDCSNKFHALDNLTENDVGTVKPRGDDGSDEELRAVGVLASICHGQDTWLGVLPLEVLVFELLAVDRLATSTVASREVTTLEHELGDDAVEFGSFVTKAMLSRGELTEIPGSLWDVVVVELEDDAPGGLAADSDVEENVGHDAVEWKETSWMGSKSF